MRFFGAYGPYEPVRKITTRFLTAVARGDREFTLRGDGRNLIDFMYVDDAVDGLLGLITHARPARTTLDFCVRSPEPVGELVAAMARVTGSDIAIHHDGVTEEYIEFRSGDRRMADDYRFVPMRAVRRGLCAAARFRGDRARCGGSRVDGPERRRRIVRPVVVLGAGPAGISAGWRLAEHGTPVMVLERDTAVGGMGKTLQLGGYGVDFGPHTFHIRETDESRDVIRIDPAVLRQGPADPDARHPGVSPGQVLRLSAGAAAGAVRRQAVAVGAHPLRLPRRDGEDDVQHGRSRRTRSRNGACGTSAGRCTTSASASTRSGSGVCPTSQISSKQAQRVAKLNLKNIILRTLGIKADPAAHFTEYMYPRAGISDLFENMAARFRDCGGDLRLQTPAVRLERDGNRIARVAYRQNGHEAIVPCARRRVDAAVAGAGAR